MEFKEERRIMKKETKFFDTFYEKDMEKALLECFSVGGKFTFWPKGRSMRPTIREGKDSVELSPFSKIEKNCIYLYKRPDGSFVLHRLTDVKEDFLLFAGDNQLKKEKVKKEQIIACVSTLWRGEKNKGEKGACKLFLFLNSFFFIRKIFVRTRALKKRFTK